MLAHLDREYSEKERSRMYWIALAGINSFAFEPGTGFSPGTATPQEHAFSEMGWAI